MATISLTQQETLLSFELDESQIEMVRADAGGSYVERSDPHNTGYNGNPLFVTQTPAQIAAQAENLIPLVISKTGDQWTSVFLNGSVNHFGSVQADTTTVLGNSRFEYFHNGNTMEIYLAQETPVQIASLLQQVENESNNPVATPVSGAGTLTAEQLATGYLALGSGIYTVTFPSATALASQLHAVAGSVFTLVVTKTGPGTATITIGAGMANGVVAPSTVTPGDAAVYQIAFASTTSAVISQLV